MNYVYGFSEDINSDPRSSYLNHDIKVLQVSEDGSIYFVVYGYMNRGSYEGKVGVALYSYNGQTKLIEEIGFYESDKSAQYVMQEVEELAYLSREGKFYFCVDGNIAVCDILTGATDILVAYEEGQERYMSKDQSCVVVDCCGQIRFWMLENGDSREIKVSGDAYIMPQGFIANDFVFGLAKPEHNVLQSDGTYAQYMSELRIQDAQGELQKQYLLENILITDCTITGNQIVLERANLVNGNIIPTSPDQIVASKGKDDNYNTIVSAMTSSYQTIKQVELKNKINIQTLKHKKAQEVFFEGSRSIEVVCETGRKYLAAGNPWRVVAYVTEPGEAMLIASDVEGFARDEKGLIIWKKAATVTKNQIMAIELETATSERSSKNICLDIMLRQAGNPLDTIEALNQGKTCQEILANVSDDHVPMDVTGSSLSALLYYTNQDIPIMVLYENGEALLITGYNQFNVVVMDPVARKLGYMSRSDATKMLEETENQVFTYYRRAVN
jgi:hypothetical protein